MKATTKPKTAQGGGFVLGLIVGLLLGLAVALGVALYITKVPVPLMNKTPPHTAEQDAAEAQKNKNWDPNAALAGKAGAKANAAQAAAASAAQGNPPEPRTAPIAEGQRPPPVLPPPANAASGATPAAIAASRAAAAELARSTRNPAQILAGQGDAGAAGTDGYTYFVQVGAYSKPEDAEQQRAKLAMQGYGAKVSEREQNGRAVHRVRLGPFDSKEEAEAQQARIHSAEPEATLVRVERQKQ